MWLRLVVLGVSVGEPIGGNAPAFTLSDLDRLGEHRADLEQLKQLLQGAHNRCLVVDGAGHVLVRADDMQLATRELEARRDSVFLGRDADTAWFAQTLPRAAARTDESWLDLRSAAALLPATQASLAAYASALLHWQLTHQFCGRCGRGMQLMCAGHKAVCSDCGLENFPRTDPVVIGLVWHCEQVLLVRQAAWPKGRFAAIAGFVEPGESLEAAFARETQEEAGITVRDARYVGSQPWPFPTSIMIGFFAEAESTAVQLGVELESARWFDHATLQAAIDQGEISMPSPYSLSRHLIDRWFLARTGTPLRTP